MYMETAVVQEGDKVRTMRKRCHLCHGKKQKCKTKHYCTAPACEAKARGKRYWVCNKCWDMHLDEVAAEYDDTIG